MSLTASREDRQAYVKLGGALDNLTSVYTYAAEGLSILGAARGPLANGRMARILKASDYAQKAITYVRSLQQVLDEQKREGGLLKLGIDISLDLTEHFLEVSLTTHPYYAYHKAMIDALADALNANRNSREAVDSYRRAVAAANSTALASEFKRIEARIVDVSAEYSLFGKTVRMAADIKRGGMTDDFARKKIAEYGGRNLFDSLADLDTWRAHWAGLAFDAMQLQIMAGVELNVAIEAMKKAKGLIATLMEGSNTNRVAGYGAINNIEWEKYDQIVGQKKPDLSLMDPIKFAQGNYDKAAAWSQEFAEMCDFVRSSAVLFSSYFDHQLERLNRVLYG